jgi:hypothetical protein
LRAPAEKRGFAEARLLTHWEEIVGAEVASIALPLKITYGRGFGGTLVLLTTGRACACSRNAAAPDRGECERLLWIPRRVAGAGDADRTHGICRRTGGVSERAENADRAPDPKRLAQVTEGLDEIENEDLRAALEALARKVVTP